MQGKQYFFAIIWTATTVILSVYQNASAATTIVYTWEGSINYSGAYEDILGIGEDAVPFRIELSFAPGSNSFLGQDHAGFWFETENLTFELNGRTVTGLSFPAAQLVFYDRNLSGYIDQPSSRDRVSAFLSVEFQDQFFNLITLSAEGPDAFSIETNNAKLPVFDASGFSGPATIVRFAEQLYYPSHDTSAPLAVLRVPEPSVFSFVAPVLLTFCLVRRDLRLLALPQVS